MLTDDTYIYAADVASIEHGAVLAVRVADRDILICRVKEDFFAVENQCSHARSKLENGRLRAHRLICPLHGAAFDVRNGAAKGNPATLPIRTYPVRVIDNRIEIKIE